MPLEKLYLVLRANSIWGICPNTQLVRCGAGGAPFTLLLPSFYDHDHLKHMGKCGGWGRSAPRPTPGLRDSFSGVGRDQNCTLKQQQTNRQTKKPKSFPMVLIMIFYFWDIRQKCVLSLEKLFVSSFVK